MFLNVDAGFLWLPVSRTSPIVKLHFFHDSIKFQEIDINLDSDHPEYYSVMDVSSYIGQTIEIRSALSDCLTHKLFFRDRRPDTHYSFRPKIHFTAPTGWINDPNGLIFTDGLWHLYHQWNPYGTEWGNMYWGHAVSRDLITWEHKGIAMEPDEFGTVFSGCAWPDSPDTAGFGKNTLLFFYTAAGGCNQWSSDAGNLHTQRLAISADRGETLLKKGLVLDHIKGGNRDPKVFRHEDSSAYIMVLFLDEYEFAVFRSKDLIHWKESQRFSAPKMRECPDMFELPVTNEPYRKKWVFWSADGYYLVGKFDGYRFVPETEVLTAYDTSLPYAAQTYAGVNDRVISVAWLRTGNDHGNFRGMMSVPSELSLVRQADGYRIQFRPVRELWKRFALQEKHMAASGSLTLPAAEKPVVLKTSWATDEIKEITTGGNTIRVRSKSDEILLILDSGIAEYWTDDGMLYGAVEINEDALFNPISFGAGIRNVEIYQFVS